jgi:acyl-coenzyme A thioesterase PaaI-like protein
VTAPALAPASSLELQLDDAWAYGAGVLHGGWLLETITAAALERTGHPHPLAVSAHFLAAPALGPAVVEVEPLREGRTVGSLRARLAQEGRAKVEVLVTAGTLPEAGITPRHLAAHPPQMPPPEMCIRNEMPTGLPRNGILENLEIRLDPATAAWTQGSFGGGAEVRAWVRSTSGREVDPLMLLTVADALPPVTFELGISGWVPTLELTVYLRSLPVQGLAALRPARAPRARRLAGRGVRGLGLLRPARGAGPPARGVPGMTSYDVDLDPSWSVGGKPHGGYLLRSAVELALDEAHPHPLAVSAHYVSSPDHGVASVDVERLRTGRRVASSRAGSARDGCGPRGGPGVRGHPVDGRPVLELGVVRPRCRRSTTAPHARRRAHGDPRGLLRPRRPADGPASAQWAVGRRRGWPRCGGGCAAPTVPTPRRLTCSCSRTRCRRSPSTSG